MDSPSVSTLEDLPRLGARLPSVAVAISGDLLYPDFRVREFPDLLSVRWALLVWTSGDLSLKDTAAVVSAAGIKVSKSSLEERFERATGFFQLLLSMMLCGNACYPKGDELRVVVADSTSLSAPGAKGADFRVHALHDSATGAFIGAEITDASVGEGAAHHLLGRESLGMDDPVLHPHRLEASIAAETPLDMPVRIPARFGATKGADWHKHPKVRFVEARLIGIRGPKGVMWLLTNMPADALPATVAGELYRRRWQIELLFKALKGLVGLDRLKSRGPTAIAWICGKLMLAALAQRLLPSYESPESHADAGEPYRAGAWSRLSLALKAVLVAIIGSATRTP